MSDTKGEFKGASGDAGLAWVTVPPITVVSTHGAFEAAKADFVRAMEVQGRQAAAGGGSRMTDMIEVLGNVRWSDGRQLAVYRQGGLTVGLLMFRDRGKEIHVVELAGNPEYRSIGPLLLAFCLNLRPLLSLIPLTGSKPFYVRMGFAAGPKKEWVLDPTSPAGAKVWQKLGGLWTQIGAPAFGNYVGLFEPVTP